VSGALDGPIELARLVPADELDELGEALCGALGGELAIFGRDGRQLSGGEVAGSRRELHHDGERVGAIVASGPNAPKLLELAQTMIGLLIHHAHARDLAASTHEDAMRVTFGELTEHNQRLQRAVARLE
jgi:hypothetical protein